MKDLRDNQLCYVCGSKNEAGLRTAFEIDRDADPSQAASRLPRRTRDTRASSGGIISALLDEGHGKLAFSLGLPAVTAEMTVKFRSPAAPSEELLVTGGCGILTGA